MANQLSIDATSNAVRAAAEYGSDPYYVQAVTDSGVYNAQLASCLASYGQSFICYRYYGWHGRRRMLRGVTA